MFLIKSRFATGLRVVKPGLKDRMQPQLERTEHKKSPKEIVRPHKIVLRSWQSHWSWNSISRCLLRIVKLLLTFFTKTFIPFFNTNKTRRTMNAPITRIAAASSSSSYCSSPRKALDDIEVQSPLRPTRRPLGGARSLSPPSSHYYAKKDHQDNLNNQ